MEYRIDPFTIPGKMLDSVVTAIASATGTPPRITPVIGDAKLAGNGHANETTGSTYTQFRSALTAGHADVINSAQIHEWIAAKGTSASQYSYLTSKAKEEGWLKPAGKRGTFKIKR